MTETSDAWEADIAALLTDLADVQRALLDVLTEKRSVLAAGNDDALAEIGQREGQLAARLQDCHQRRLLLLERAAEQGYPADSIRSLSDALPAEHRDRLRPGIHEAQNRARLLQHESLTNWVIVQRSLLHLSQLVEIIATGGRMKPTYGSGTEGQCTGSLVDQAA